MGFFSELKDSFMEGYNGEHKSKNAKNTEINVSNEISILFSPTHEMRMVEPLRKKTMGILFQTLNYMLGIEVRKECNGIFFSILEDGGAVTPMCLNFVISNDRYLIKQGTCGLGQGGITLKSDYPLQDLAYDIVKVLTDIGFEEVQICNKVIPFHEQEMLDSAANNLERNIARLKKMP